LITAFHENFLLREIMPSRGNCHSLLAVGAIILHQRQLPQRPHGVRKDTQRFFLFAALCVRLCVVCGLDPSSAKLNFTTAGYWRSLDRTGTADQLLNREISDRVDSRDGLPTKESGFLKSSRVPF
jgi:hypothetical protein